MMQINTGVIRAFSVIYQMNIRKFGNDLLTTEKKQRYIYSHKNYLTGEINGTSFVCSLYPDRYGVKHFGTPC